MSGSSGEPLYFHRPNDVDATYDSSVGVLGSVGERGGQRGGAALVVVSVLACTRVAKHSRGFKACDI